MNIMSINPVDFSGKHGFLENWIGEIPPGFIETTVTPDEFYGTNGFVIPTIDNGKIIAITENQNAKSVWRSTQPEQIRADIDFLSAMQGVEL